MLEVYKLTLNVPNWSNQHLKPNEIIVRASSEEEARNLATKCVITQPKPYGGQEVEPNYWQNSKYVFCERYQGADFSAKEKAEILSKRLIFKGEIPNIFHIKSCLVSRGVELFIICNDIEQNTLVNFYVPLGNLASVLLLIQRSLKLNKTELIGISNKLGLERQLKPFIDEIDSTIKLVETGLDGPLKDFLDFEKELASFIEVVNRSRDNNLNLRHFQKFPDGKLILNNGIILCQIPASVA
ncbi:MAG: hypothetical protein HYX61_10245 [Gammaproteobacteria bacterium]|jgi:hypothetical protein|nr:hypothetical protein [Gammaproteobacteria bacterium]